MSDNAPATSATAVSAPSRQIRLWGSTARLVVGLGALIAAAVMGVSRLDLLLGLVVLPTVEIGVVTARGADAPPLRLYGSTGHYIN